MAGCTVRVGTPGTVVVESPTQRPPHCGAVTVLKTVVIRAKTRPVVDLDAEPVVILADSAGPAVAVAAIAAVADATRADATRAVAADGVLADLLPNAKRGIKADIRVATVAMTAVDDRGATFLVTSFQASAAAVMTILKIPRAEDIAAAFSEAAFEGGSFRNADAKKLLHLQM